MLKTNQFYYPAICILLLIISSFPFISSILLYIMNTNTSSFKTTAREKTPSWTNRFRRDVNDLMYNVIQIKDIEYIKKKSKIIDVTNTMKTLISQTKNHSWLNRQSLSPKKQNFDFTNKNSQIKRSESLKILSKTQNTFKKSINPQTYFSLSSIKEKIDSPKKQMLKTSLDQFELMKQKNKNCNKMQLNKLGLSDFQFNLKTVQGNVISKRGFNIDLNKSKTQKFNPIKKSYFNETQVIVSKRNDQKKEEIKKRKQLMKYRNFSQYSPHSVYGVKKIGQGGSLDKFYSISNEQLNLVKRSPPKFDIQKITPRPEPPVKMSTQLDYDSYKQIAKSNKSKPLFQIHKLQRNLVIGRQVISPERGCYR